MEVIVRNDFEKDKYVKLDSVISLVGQLDNPETLINNSSRDIVLFMLQNVRLLPTKFY